MWLISKWEKSSLEKVISFLVIPWTYHLCSLTLSSRSYHFPTALRSAIRHVGFHFLLFTGSLPGTLLIIQDLKMQCFFKNYDLFLKRYGLSPIRHGRNRSRMLPWFRQRSLRKSFVVGAISLLRKVNVAAVGTPFQMFCICSWSICFTTRWLRTPADESIFRGRVSDIFGQKVELLIVELISPLFVVVERYHLVKRYPAYQELFLFHVEIILLEWFYLWVSKRWFKHLW